VIGCDVQFRTFEHHRDRTLVQRLKASHVTALYQLHKLHRVNDDMEEHERKSSALNVYLKPNKNLTRKTEKIEGGKTPSLRVVRCIVLTLLIDIPIVIKGILKHIRERNDASGSCSLKSQLLQ
jgi:hypothetical protein